MTAFDRFFLIMSYVLAIFFTKKTLHTPQIKGVERVSVSWSAKLMAKGVS